MEARLERQAAAIEASKAETQAAKVSVYSGPPFYRNYYKDPLMAAAAHALVAQHLPIHVCVTSVLTSRPPQRSSCMQVNVNPCLYAHVQAALEAHLNGIVGTVEWGYLQLSNIKANPYARLHAHAQAALAAQLNDRVGAVDEAHPCVLVHFHVRFPRLPWRLS